MGSNRKSVAARRSWKAGLLGGVVVLSTLVAGLASAQPGPASGPHAGPGGHGPMGHHRGMGGRMGMGPGALLFASPERIGRVVDRMLDGLAATDAQRARIKQIAFAAATDLRAQMAQGRGAGQQGLQALTAPSVDAAAVEQARQQMLQQHDRVSRRAAQALLEMAQVLTPEQRATLGARMKDRQARMQERRARMQERGAHRQERGERVERPPAEPRRP